MLTRILVSPEVDRYLTFVGADADRLPVYNRPGYTVTPPAISAAPAEEDGVNRPFFRAIGIALAVESAAAFLLFAVWRTWLMPH